MADLVIANGDIRDRADRTEVCAIYPSLVLRCQQDRIATLAEPAPIVLEDISFHQDANGIFQFEMIFNHKRIAADPTDESWLALLPSQGLEEVIVANLNISRG